MGSFTSLLAFGGGLFAGLDLRLGPRPTSSKTR